MAVAKLEQLSQSVVQDPSMATGAVPAMDWMDIPVTFKPGNYAYPAKKDKVEYLDSQKGLHFPNAREWSPEDDDWKLPENWKEIIIDGLGERLEKFRSLKIFMDCCVRCGACADKCHFYLGTGDSKIWTPTSRFGFINPVAHRSQSLRGMHCSELKLRSACFSRYRRP